MTTSEGIESPAELTGRRPRIIVGVDGSSASMVALEAAVGEAELRGASLEPVKVWRHQDYYYAGPKLMRPPPVSGEDVAQVAKDRLAKALKGVPEDLEVHPQVLDGHPAKVLIDLAQGADLLVVGRRGLGGLAGLLLRSVSRACAHHAPCSVLIVPSPHQTGT